MRYEIRAVRPRDWPRVKFLRLAALRDPLSTVAFGSTYERELALPNREWQRRARGTAFVAVDANADAEWIGSVTVLVETGEEFPVPQTHVVGMYVRPDHRGTGVARRLMLNAIEKSWQDPQVARVRLWVTEANERACAFYGGWDSSAPVCRHPIRLSRPSWPTSWRCRGRWSPRKRVWRWGPRCRRRGSLADATSQVHAGCGVLPDTARVPGRPAVAGLFLGAEDGERGEAQAGPRP